MKKEKLVKLIDFAIAVQKEINKLPKVCQEKSLIITLEEMKATLETDEEES